MDYQIEFRRGAYEVGIGVVVLIGRVSVNDLVRYARIVDSRIKSTR